jgi:imidazolonepropionase-like amidohydrolase
MKLPLTVLGCFLFASGFAQPEDTVKYTVVTAGKITGIQTNYSKNSNEYFYHFEFNDRGRGPSLSTHIKTNEKGIVVLKEISGIDYFKNKVQEKFEVKSGRASWKNKFENENVVFNGQLYSSIDGTPGEEELTYKILKSQPENKIAVLPSGHISFKKVKELTIIGENNNKQTLQLIGFSGLGGPPSYSWYTTDGHYFGNLSEWSSIILHGFEKNIEPLLVIQKEIEKSFYNNLANTVTEINSTGIAIKNVTVFNAGEGSTFANATVLIKNNRIEKTGNSLYITIPPGYKIIDGTGKFLMPGLWEMHGHFFMQNGPMMIAQGVTNLRDMGNNDELWNVKKKIDKDTILGPEINVVSGFIDKAGEFAAPTGTLINSLQEGINAIESYKQKGCTQIKLYSSINPEWVKPMAVKAHNLGMRVCGHIPAFMTASQAIDAGYDEVTHLNMLMLNFFGDTVDTRNMSRFKLVGNKGFTIDLNSEAVKNFVQKLKEKNIAVDPTINVFEGMFTDMPGKISKAYLPIAAYLPAETKRYAMAGAYIDADSLAGAYAKSFATMKKLLKVLYDNGITILAGTDGGIVQHELEIYSECGIPNYDVLRMATYWPAKIHGMLDNYGTVDAGKIANLILIDGDPKRNIKDIRKIFLTIKEGKLYYPKKIYAAYGWKYYY